ncbi:NAD(P)-binding domain-containing protein [Streptomyces cirratus]|uniref:NAD(P)-binding domain-containing protein n=1 Tax=Streptomyces cirratus TaxID=68187 RepID=UPI003619D593
MRTGIIGAGRIGTVLARILVAAGHEVVLANARGPRTLAPLLAELGAAASAAGPAEAAGRADLVVLMVPFDHVRGCCRRTWCRTRSWWTRPTRSAAPGPPPISADAAPATWSPSGTPAPGS